MYIFIVSLSQLVIMKWKIYIVWNILLWFWKTQEHENLYDIFRLDCSPYVDVFETDLLIRLFRWHFQRNNAKNLLMHLTTEWNFSVIMQSIYACACVCVTQQVKGWCALTNSWGWDRVSADKDGGAGCQCVPAVSCSAANSCTRAASAQHLPSKSCQSYCCYKNYTKAIETSTTSHEKVV